MTKYVAYGRVSTLSQGRSGLGMEAQEATIRAFLRPEDELILPMFVEVESGKRMDRPELAKALRHAKLTGATLLVSKLDRLARSVAFVSQLMEAKVEFVACDMPDATRMTIHIIAAVDENERKRISDRTKAALQAAKERGTKLGGFRGHKVDSSLGRAAVSQRVASFVAPVREVIATLEAEGVTGPSALAKRLNGLGVRTSRGGAWTATQVTRVLAA